jgi:preprotein translocase subunit SecB
MTDADGKNGGQGPAPQGQGVQVQVRVLGQYIKDLSFESPNVRKLIAGTQENPNLNLEINVQPEKVSNDVYEVALTFSAKAEGKTTGTIYDLELIYAGLFRIENATPEILDVMLNVNCANLLFPFMRRIAADLTREGGFPPLLLDPVDFGSLLMRKREAAAAAGRA